MKNIPRVFLGNNIESGITIPAARDVSHYLAHVMRTKSFLAFGGGNEFNATLSDDARGIIIGDKTSHTDPSNDITLLFSPIKRTDDLINMATQLGVKYFQPIITERTVERFVKWDRMEKIAISAAEQSNRNSVPTILPSVKFSELDLSDLCFADERAAYGRQLPTGATCNKILVGPEGGFSTDEFATLDAAGAVGISLGKTILRAELAAAIAINRIIK